MLYHSPGRAGPESILVTLLKSWFVSSGGTPPSFSRHSRRVLQVTGRSSDRRIRGPSRSCIGTSVRPSAFLFPVPFDRESHIRRCSSWPAPRRAVALAIDLSHWIVCRSIGRERRLIIVTFSLLSLCDPYPFPRPTLACIPSSPSSSLRRSGTSPPSRWRNLSRKVPHKFEVVARGEGENVKR